MGDFYEFTNLRIYVSITLHILLHATSRPDVWASTIGGTSEFHWWYSKVPAMELGGTSERDLMETKKVFLVFSSDDVFSCAATSGEVRAGGRVCSQTQSHDSTTKAHSAKTSAEGFCLFFLKMPRKFRLIH